MLMETHLESGGTSTMEFFCRNTEQLESNNYLGFHLILPFKQGNFKIVLMYLESSKTTYLVDKEGHESPSIKTIKTAHIYYTFIFTMSNI